MELFIKVNGVLEKQVKRENLPTRMGTYMREDGQATNYVATASSGKQMALYSVEIGYIVLSMVKVTKLVSMVLNILESTLRVENMVWEFRYGKQAILTLVNGKKISSTALEFFNGKTGVNIMANGGTHRCMGLADTSFKTKSFMKANTMAIKNMVSLLVSPLFPDHALIFFPLLPPPPVLVVC